MNLFSSYFITVLSGFIIEKMLGLIYIKLSADLRLCK